MVKRWKQVKVDVTVNGGGFDTPSSVEIDDDGEIPICNMVFPGGLRSRYKALKRDIVRVYVGLDEIPDEATFTGYLREESGISETRMDLSGALYRGTRDFRRVTDYDNFDGQEIGNALRNIVSNTNGLGFLSFNIEQTSPIIQVPVDTRFDRGTDKHGLMREFRDLAVDARDPIHIGRYTFFTYGDTFYFRKIPNPKTANPSVTLTYGDSLISWNPESPGRPAINRSTVVGKDDVFGYYENAQRKLIDGLQEDDPISDDGVLSDGEGRETARVNVISNLFQELPLLIDSHLLIDAIPNATVVEITGAPYGLSDNYLVQSKSIGIGEGQFEVSCQVSTPIDVISEAITQVLGLNRDLPINAPASGSALI